MTTADIARRLGSSRSLVVRVLKELERGELLERIDPYRWWLGLGALEVGGAYLSRADFTHIARGEMRTLAEVTGETINLGTLRGASVVYVMKEEGQHAIVTISHVGKALPANCSALGKVLLAQLSWSEVEARLGSGELPALTDRSITDRGRLQHELEEVRSRGYGTEHGESVAGRGCVAVAIQLPGLQRPSAFSISCAEQDFLNRREELAQALHASRDRLARGAGSVWALRDAMGESGEAL